MKQKVLPILGIIGILVVVVAMSGCTSSGGNLTYSTGGVTFNYPDDFKNTTAPASIISGSSSWSAIGYLSNSQNIIIQIQNNPNTDQTLTPSLAIIGEELSVKQNNGSVLSTTNDTNPNGVVVAGSISTLTDPTSNNLLRYYDMTFSAKNGQIYSITVYGPDSSNSAILDVKNTIYNSLKVS